MMRYLVYTIMLLILINHSWAYGCIDMDYCTSTAGRFIGKDYVCYTNNDMNIGTFESLTIAITVNPCDYAPKTGEVCLRYVEYTHDDYLYLDTLARSGDYFCYDYYCNEVDQYWNAFFIHDYNSVFDNPKSILGYYSIDGSPFELCSDYAEYTVTQTKTQSDSRDDYSVVGDLPDKFDQFTEPSFIASATGYVENYLLGTEITQDYFMNTLIPNLCYWEPSHTCEKQGGEHMVADFFNVRTRYCSADYFYCNVPEVLIDGVNICSDFHGAIENYLDTTKRPLILRGIFPVYYGTGSDYFYHSNFFVILGKTGSYYLVAQGDQGIFQMSENELYAKTAEASQYGLPRGIYFSCPDSLDTSASVWFDEDEYVPGSQHDGISYLGSDDTRFMIYQPLKTPDCICIDEDSDGDSQSYTEFDYCVYTTGYYDNCYDKWPLFKDVCDNKFCVDAVGEAVDLQGTLDNDVLGRGKIDMKYVAGISNNDFIIYDINAYDYYVIDRKRADCDGENYDIIGFYGTGWVTITDDNTCDTDQRNRRCDEDHDDEMTQCFTKNCDPGTQSCRVDIGDTVAEQCIESDDCWGNAVCDGQQDSYRARCYYDGSDRYYIDWGQYDNTCGGSGFYSGMVLAYDDRLCEQAGTLCDDDHDGIWQESTYPTDQCKISIPNEGCNTFNDCFNDAPCNSYNRCGECYSTFISTNIDCVTDDKPYCVDASGDLCGGVEDYTCACCQQTDIIDSCLNLGEGEMCQNDSECHLDYYCTGDIPVPGICTLRKIDGVACDRDRMCQSDFGCNNESHCGECYSEVIELDENCIDPDKPYCTDNYALGICNLGLKYRCDCCNRPGIEDCCFETPKPEYYDHVYVYSSCVDGYDCECEGYSFNETYNITCIEYDPGDNETRFCTDCFEDNDCITKYSLNISNYCDGAYCSCNLDLGTNPTGCDTSFCFGLYPGGYSCDCDSECQTGKCIGGICTYLPPVACITNTSYDDDHDDDFILNASDTIILNANCSTGDPNYPLRFSCWYNSSILNTGFCYNNYSESICTYWCPGLFYVNRSWDQDINFTRNNGSKLNLELVVGINETFYYGDYPTTDYLKKVICFRGGTQWCGETCFDRIQNQDETAVDYGGICGNCSDSIRNGDETEIDYGGICGSCSDGIQNGYENGTLIETSIDYGGWCGLCGNGVKDNRIGEIMDGYGGVCGDCYNDKIDLYLNETEADYGGPFCGYCINDSTKALDYDWQFVKEINKSIPFSQSQCPQAIETLSFLFFFFVLLMIIGTAIFFLLAFLFAVPIIFFISNLIALGYRAYRFIKTKNLNRLRPEDRFNIR